MKPSRVLGTTYTNTTGKPIMVNISVRSMTNEDTYFELTVAGVLVAGSGTPDINNVTFLTVIVPAGSTYKANANDPSADLYYWSELR